jgi:hypothetical protein
MVEADSLAHLTATRKTIGFGHLASPLGIVFCQWHGARIILRLRVVGPRSTYRFESGAPV